jgi:hypothetical protein
MATPAELEDAYRQCHYCVETMTGIVVLRVGQTNAAIDSLAGSPGRASAAVITAANPFSIPLSAMENSGRHERLLARLSGAGHRWLPTRSQDPRGEWPDEPGVLVLGVSRAQALELARAFGQYAIVWLESGEPAQLLWASEFPSPAAANLDQHCADNRGET